jgi:hypothetical protein
MAAGMWLAGLENELYFLQSPPRLPVLLGGADLVHLMVQRCGTCGADFRAFIDLQE